MNTILRELKSPRLIWVKAALFVVAASASAVMLLLQNPSWATLALVTILAWCAARSYYFAFYVAQRYVDPAYRFSGLWSFVAHFALRR
jgi:uncharacterized membrane protein